MAWITSSFSSALVLAGLVALVLGLLGVIRALAARSRGRRSRRPSLVVMGTGLTALLVGAGAGASGGRRRGVRRSVTFGDIPVA